MEEKQVFESLKKQIWNQKTEMTLQKMGATAANEKRVALLVAKKIQQLPNKSKNSVIIRVNQVRFCFSFVGFRNVYPN